MQIEIPKELEGLLLDVAKKLALEPNSVVLNALQQYLEDQHDYHVGIQGYQRYLASGRKGTTIDELRKELGLERD